MNLPTFPPFQRGKKRTTLFAENVTIFTRAKNLQHDAVVSSVRSQLARLGGRLETVRPFETPLKSHTDFISLIYISVDSQAHAIIFPLTLSLSLLSFHHYHLLSLRHGEYGSRLESSRFVILSLRNVL